MSMAANSWNHGGTKASTLFMPRSWGRFSVKIQFNCRTTVCRVRRRIYNYTDLEAGQVFPPTPPTYAHAYTRLRTTAPKSHNALPANTRRSPWLVRPNTSQPQPLPSALRLQIYEIYPNPMVSAYLTLEPHFQSPVSSPLIFFRPPNRRDLPTPIPESQEDYVPGPGPARVSM